MSMLGSLGENLTNTMKKLAGMSVIDKKQKGCKGSS